MRLNLYSLCILCSFFCTLFAMNYHTASISFESIFETFPFITLMIYWCQNSRTLISLPESKLKRSEVFTRDLFIINFSFIFACLISLSFAYNNSDVKGWWVLIMYFIALFGLLFSFIFSTMALLIKNHKMYTFGFSFLLIILISFANFFPFYLYIPLLGNIETLFVGTCFLLIIHFLCVVGYKVTELMLRARIRKK